MLRIILLITIVLLSRSVFANDVKFNNVCFYYTINGFTPNSGVMFGDIVDIEESELSQKGVSKDLNHFTMKFGASYNRIIYNGESINMGIKSDLGYVFTFQSYRDIESHQTTWIRHPYIMAGPSLIIPSSNTSEKDSTLCHCLSYQFGIIKYGWYKPFASFPDKYNLKKDPTTFSGYIHNYSYEVIIQSGTVVVNLFLSYTHYIYKFNNLNYEFHGHVKKATNNDINLGLGFGKSF